MEDPSSEEERATTDGESEVEEEADEADLPPEEPWCPPIPPALDDPTEMEIKGAADKLDTMMNSSQPQANVFFQPENLGALPHLWLQAKLTIFYYVGTVSERCNRYGGGCICTCSPQLYAPAG